jgi:hypothetical protein
VSEPRNWTEVCAALEASTAALSEMTRRRDEWRAKAEGYDELANAVRAGIEEAGDRNLSRLFLRGALVDSEKRLADAEAERDALRAQLESTLKDRAYIMAERDRTFALMLARAEEAEAERDALRAGAVRLRVKPLEWEPVEAPCTRFKAPAMGGHMMVVELDPGTGIYSAGIDLDGLCFRFVQAMTFDSDGYGHSAPAKYPTVELAKAAAQADYERRILSSLAGDA